MPYNGQGQFVLKHTWANEAAAGTPMLPANFDDQDSDIATALSNALTRDGQSLPIANLPMGGYKFTGLPAGTSPGDSVNYGQVFNAPAFTAPTAVASPSLSDNPLRLATVGLLQATAFAAALPAQSLGLLLSDGQHASFSQTTTGFALNATKGANIASATTIDLTTVGGEFMHVTGATTITGITVPVGAQRVLVFDGVLTLANSSTLLLPGAANVTTQAGDRVTVRGDTSGTIVVDYLRADGSPVALPSASVTGVQLGGSYAVPGYANGMRTLTTDTILTAFGKLQSQADNQAGITSNQAGQISSLQSTTSAQATQIAGKANSATTLAGYGITDAIPSGGGNLTGSLTFANNTGLFFKDTGGATHQTLVYSGDNSLYLNMPVGAYLNFMSVQGALIARLDNGGTFSANTLTQTSDERKKKHWQRLPGDFIAKLAGIRKSGLFHWKKGGELGLGVGAQSLEAILPVAVHTDEHGAKTVNYGAAAMVSAVELARAVIALQARVAELEAR